ncbi:MAG: sigma-70 family RNA polymerase sigma factor [Planctomycetota bacterium]|nr:MAG: sigma-70 family RNA polymerase sigma factor [Planctomycetota bacterium]
MRSGAGSGRNGPRTGTRERVRTSNPGKDGGVELETLDDRALVARTQEGEREAFSALVSRYQDRVVNLVYRRLNDREAALDVAQEVFIKAYRGLEGFEGNSQFFTWLFRITMNETVSARRRTARRRPPLSLDRGNSDGERLPEPPDSSYEPAAAAERNDETAMIRRAIYELDDDVGQVLVLRDIEGLSYQEIASILGIPVGSVKSRIHRARQVLKDRLAKVIERE